VTSGLPPKLLLAHLRTRNSAPFPEPPFNALARLLVLMAATTSATVGISAISASRGLSLFEDIDLASSSTNTAFAG
jgi:hypothetical protein